ncbi:hypothetical protein Pint_15955 [Pistacia integerrima]|uniref:Uncharacterized protein n=1 Tax=Pistacia integerrima TaxID=434235 RepID=A0ACC0Z7P5_9ROSI|nr:hypothetical protein Pint_15955 [Pistacia integerrima]
MYVESHEGKRSNNEVKADIRKDPDKKNVEPKEGSTSNPKTERMITSQRDSLVHLSKSKQSIRIGNAFQWWAIGM